MGAVKMRAAPKVSPAAKMLAQLKARNADEITLEDIFEHVDDDGSGCIDIEEAQDFVSEMEPERGEPFTQDELEAAAYMFHTFAGPGEDACLNFEEMVQAVDIVTTFGYYDA